MDNTNSTSTTAPQWFAANFCQYRLPCGYCERLGRDCPKQLATYPYSPAQPTWEVGDNPTAPQVTCGLTEKDLEVQRQAFFLLRNKLIRDLDIGGQDDGTA